VLGNSPVDCRACAASSWWQPKHLPAFTGALTTVRILDPACGSGAFLLEASGQMHAHYQQANARLTEPVNQALFADVECPWNVPLSWV
jgi:hypothetical protein